MYLEKINDPSDLKKMNMRQLRQLAEELRAEIIKVVSERGGHLASNLGMVELTIAIHYVFDAPGDKLVFDGQAELTCRRLYQENHLMKKERFTTPLEDASLTLRADLFKEDALLVEAPAFTAITLRRAAGRDVKFTFDPVPWLGLWSRYLESGEVKYICLEPWLGVDDICDADGLIEHKVGIQALSPGQARAFTISIEPK